MGVDEGAAEEGGQGVKDQSPTGASGPPDALLTKANLAPTTAPAMSPEGAPAQSDGSADAGASEDGALPDDGTVADPLADLLQAGAAMLQGLAAQRRPGAAPLIRIERDPESGQSSLRIPIPDPALLRQLARAQTPWLKS
jgi:hypothetical protein